MDRPDITESDRPGWQQEVRALEDEGRRAFIARDLERLKNLWSDHLIVNSPINRVHDRQRILDLLGAGTIAHSSMESQIEVIERYANLVVVMGSENVTNSPDGPIIRRRFTNVWHADGDSWRLIVRHANVITDQTHPLS
jgi:ketosteroid isomerase-like protein